MLIAFLALIFIRPFISSLGNPLFDTYYSYSLIILSLLLIKSKKDLGKGFPGHIFFLVFFLAIIISSIASLNPLKSLQELPKFLSYFFIFYVTYYAGDLEKKRIILTLILSAAFVSLYAIYWFYLGSANLLEYMQEQKIIYPFAQELLSRRRAFIPFVLPSMLAGYLIMMLPISVGYLFRENKDSLLKFSLKNTLLSLPILLIAVALLLTKSVGAFLSIFLSLLIFIILSRVFNKRVFLLLLILLLAFASIFIMRSYKTAYFTSPIFSFQSRFIYWQKALSVILEHPFRGTGLGNSPFIQSKYAHNSYLQIWAEFGILGVIGFLGFLYMSFKAIQSKRLIADKLYAGCIIAIFAFLIHNLVDFSFFLPEVYTFWWIIVALLLSTVSTVQKT